MKRSGLLLVVAGLVPCPALAQSVVYDNTTTFLRQGVPLLNPHREDSAEMGDEVRLAGKHRHVTELRLRFWYSGTEPGTFDVRVRFRSLLPDKPTPGPAILKDRQIVAYRDTPSPGPAFYDSGFVTGLQVAPGMNEYTFAIPNVKVPDRFVWTVQAGNAKGIQGSLGPAYYGRATVGSSEDFFWHSDLESKWIAYSWGGDLLANFGARIVAGPAPKKGAARGS